MFLVFVYVMFDFTTDYRTIFEKTKTNATIELKKIRNVIIRSLRSTIALG